MTKRLDQLALLLLAVAGLSLIVGESMATPSDWSSAGPRPAGTSATAPADIRSGVVYWDYRVGIPAQPATILTVSADKIFILTDITITPMLQTPNCGDPIDIKIYENTTLKTIVYCPEDQIHFVSGIPFAPGSQVNLSQPAVGGTLLGNVTFGITVSGYEYSALSPPAHFVYLPVVNAR